MSERVTTRFPEQILTAASDMLTTVRRIRQYASDLSVLIRPSALFVEATIMKNGKVAERKAVLDSKY